MTFDVGFDKFQLDQLGRQYLPASSVKGRIVFFGDADDRLSHATWQFDETDYEALQQSGFKFALMNVLDNLITYRSRENQPNAGQGMVSVANNTLTICWLSPEAAEQFRNDE